LWSLTNLKALSSKKKKNFFFFYMRKAHGTVHAWFLSRGCDILHSNSTSDEISRFMEQFIRDGWYRRVTMFLGLNDSKKRSLPYFKIQWSCFWVRRQKGVWFFFLLTFRLVFFFGKKWELVPPWRVTPFCRPFCEISFLKFFLKERFFLNY